MGRVEPVEEALYDIERYITTSEAIEMTGVARITMIEWCKKFKIGHKIGGRWFVDPVKLSLLLRGSLKGGL